MSAKTRDVRLGPRDVTVERRANGVVHLKSPHPLGNYPVKISERLEHWASVAPGRVFLAQREGGGAWQKFTYAGVREGARRVLRASRDSGVRRVVLTVARACSAAIHQSGRPIPRRLTVASP